MSRWRGSRADALDQSDGRPPDGRGSAAGGVIPRQIAHGDRSPEALGPRQSAIVRVAGLLASGSLHDFHEMCFEQRRSRASGDQEGERDHKLRGDEEPPHRSSPVAESLEWTGQKSKQRKNLESAAAESYRDLGSAGG